MKLVTEIGFEDLKSTYRGKANKCCCGCAGNHYEQEEGMTADQQKYAKRTMVSHLNYINERLDQAELILSGGRAIISVETETSVTIIYLRTAEERIAFRKQQEAKVA